MLRDNTWNHRTDPQRKIWSTTKNKNQTSFKIFLEEKATNCIAFSPQIHNPTLIVRKHQPRQSWGIFSQTPDQYSSKMWRPRKTKDWRTVSDWRRLKTGRWDACGLPDGRLEQSKGHQGTASKTQMKSAFQLVGLCQSSVKSKSWYFHNVETFWKFTFTNIFLNTLQYAIAKQRHQLRKSMIWNIEKRWKQFRKIVEGNPTIITVEELAWIGEEEKCRQEWGLWKNLNEGKYPDKVPDGTETLDKSLTW